MFDWWKRREHNDLANWIIEFGSPVWELHHDASVALYSGIIGVGMIMKGSDMDRPWIASFTFMDSSETLTASYANCGEAIGIVERYGQLRSRPVTE